MRRDIIDIDRELTIYDMMTLDIDTSTEEGDPISLINPSASRNYIYMRALQRPCSEKWISGICLYNKRTSEFVMVPEHPDCENIEDLRIFDFQDRVWFVGYLRRSSDNIFETRVGYFDATNSRIEKIIGCISLPSTHVKNITPLLLDDQLWLIDIHTGTVFCADSKLERSHTIDCSLLDKHMANFTNHIFGTTPYIQLTDTVYGGLVHVTKRIGSQTCYVYLWIEIDVATWTICYVSKPYIINKLGIVFVSHIEKIGKDRFQLMFGQDDKNTCRCETTLDDLRCAS